jgi:type III secretory pathway component EscV
VAERVSLEPFADILSVFNRLYTPHYPVTAGLAADEFFVDDTPDRPRLLNVEAREAVNPVNGAAAAIVRETGAALDTCRRAGLTTWGPYGFLVLSLAAGVRDNAAAFQTMDATRHALDSLNRGFPALVGAALKRFTQAQIRLVLSELLQEEISVRDLRSILESLPSINGTTDVDTSRYIVFDFVDIAQRAIRVSARTSRRSIAPHAADWL